MNINISTEYININNFRQNIMTISSDDSNPVLLIVHGGAGSPDRPLVKKYNSELAEYYTVVCWDQRGSGLSYTKEDLTIDIMLNDLKSVVEFLRNRYNQSKIYIAGHSWGAYLGLRFSFMHPEYRNERKRQYFPHYRTKCTGSFNFRRGRYDLSGTSHTKLV